MPETLDEKLARLRSRTNDLEPPFDLASRVISRVATRRGPKSIWASPLPYFRSLMLTGALSAAVGAWLWYRADEQLLSSVELTLDFNEVSP